MKFNARRGAATEPIKRKQPDQDPPEPRMDGPRLGDPRLGDPRLPHLTSTPRAKMGPPAAPARSGPPPVFEMPQAEALGADETNFDIAAPEMPDTGARALEEADALALGHQVRQSAAGLRKRGYIAGTPYTRVAPANVRHEHYYEVLGGEPDAVTQYTQLLIWCLNKRIEGLGQEAEVTYENKVKQDALLKLVMKLANNKLPLNWSHAVVNHQLEGSESKFAPNNKNITNQKKIAHLQRLLTAMQDEKQEWLERLQELEERPQRGLKLEPVKLPQVQIDCGDGAAKISAAVAEAKYQLEKTAGELISRKAKLHDPALLGSLGLM